MICSAARSGTHRPAQSLTLFVVSAFAPMCIAQISPNPRPEGDAVWRWEASSNGGASWATGALEVESSTSSVLVRARCQFTQFPATYYGGVMFDAVVGNVGPSDAISNLRFGNTQFNVFLGILDTQRIGSDLKVDWISDTLPPGQGNRWLNPNQSSPQGGTSVSFANPIETMSYTLSLDGSLGERSIYGVFRPQTYPGISPDRTCIVYDGLNFADVYFQTLREERVVVRVVPSPASAFPVLGLGVLCLTRARKRSDRESL